MSMPSNPPLMVKGSVSPWTGASYPAPTTAPSTPSSPPAAAGASSASSSPSSSLVSSPPNPPKPTEPGESDSGTTCSGGASSCPVDWSGLAWGPRESEPEPWAAGGASRSWLAGSDATVKPKSSPPSISSDAESAGGSSAASGTGMASCSASVGAGGGSATGTAGASGDEISSVPGGGATNPPLRSSSSRASERKISCSPAAAQRSAAAS